jgi:hypothetical protein
VIDGERYPLKSFREESDLYSLQQDIRTDIEEPEEDGYAFMAAGTIKQKLIVQPLLNAEKKGVLA